MPNLSKDRGLVGLSVKETWLPAALRAETLKQRALYDPEGTLPEPQLPWTSVGMAPTAQNIDDTCYGGSA